jgi:hypothetical protein
MGTNGWKSVEKIGEIRIVLLGFEIGNVMREHSSLCDSMSGDFVLSTKWPISETNGGNATQSQKNDRHAWQLAKSSPTELANNSSQILRL